MAFEQREESVEQGLPASLFLFRWGSEPTNIFAYTDVDQPVQFDGVTYAPTVIGREKMEASGGLDNKTLQIDITPRASIIKFYQEQQPSQVVTLTIYQGHVGDPANEFLTVWTGRVIGVEQKARFARINAEPIATSMRRPGLRRHYQYGCPWALYSTECGVDKATSNVVAPVNALGSNVLEFVDGWQGVRPKGKFAGGFVQWSHLTDGSLQTRTILSVGLGQGGAGRDRLALNGKTNGLQAGQNVTLFLGCNHQQSDCAGLFNNLVNFGGQPWIPKENPVGFVNRFY